MAPMYLVWKFTRMEVKNRRMRSSIPEGGVYKYRIWGGKGGDIWGTFIYTVLEI